jgi:hypothetical protein
MMDQGEAYYGLPRSLSGLFLRPEGLYVDNVLAQYVAV